jgi:Ni,Fe-hydrogenase III component G
MMSEEKIVQELIRRFNYLQDKVRIARARRIFLEVSLDHLNEVFEYVHYHLGFKMLCAITGLDQGEIFGIIYHCGNENGILINIKTQIPRDNPVLPSLTSYFPSADAYERELIDLFGIKIQGLPSGPRYPLPDDWPEGEYPLRKEWNASRLAQEEEKK